MSHLLGSLRVWVGPAPPVVRGLGPFLVTQYSPSTPAIIIAAISREAFRPSERRSSTPLRHLSSVSTSKAATACLSTRRVGSICIDVTKWGKQRRPELANRPAKSWCPSMSRRVLVLLASARSILLQISQILVPWSISPSFSAADSITALGVLSFESTFQDFFRDS